MTLFFQKSVLIALLLLLTSCGGGSGGTEGRTISGQVIKGLTVGATVTLYSLTSTGEKTQIAVATTDANGKFTFVQTLTNSQVYLFEAKGGSYSDEISGLVTPLTAPLRAIVVGAAGETSFALSAISELAVADIERSTASNKWSAAFVNQSVDKVKYALGLLSLSGTRYVNLAALTPESAGTVSDEEVGYSFYVHLFAGFLHASKQKDTSATLSSTLQSYYALLIGGVERDDLNAIFAAGLVSAVQKIPLFAKNPTSIYASVGLPSDATVSQLNSGETSGLVTQAVPNGSLKLVDTRGYSYVSDSTTIFNDRGALLGYLRDSGNTIANLTSWSHLGYASVADVYGTAETAIGRWNGGYYFPTSVSYDVSTRLFNKNRKIAVPLSKDRAYAAGIPATNLPQCGRLMMDLKTKTKSFTMPSGLKLMLDDASKLNIQYLNGVPHVAHKIILNGSNGVNYSFSNSSYASINFDTPWATPAVGSSMQFGHTPNNTTMLTLPNGEGLVLTGLLSGNGGKKAVIAITTFEDMDLPIITAGFAADLPFENCVDYVFMPGVVNPTPTTGPYAYDYTDYPFYRVDLNFFSNGMPDFPNSGLTSTSSVEKSGNASAGIGINMPPFNFNGNTIKIPTPYIYRKSDNSTGWPAFGNAHYSMIANTPTLFGFNSTLLSVKKNITSAALKIYFNQYPVGTTHANLGTCELTLTEGGVSIVASVSFIRSAGVCGYGTNTYGEPYLQGGLDSYPSNYAVIRYRNRMGGWAALLFQRTP